MYALAVQITASAQSFPLKNTSVNYVVSSLRGKDLSDKSLIKILRDNKGLYWFRCKSELFSFDGINWKNYQFQSIIGKSTPIKLNDIKLMEDGNVWVSSSEGIYVFDSGTDTFLPIRLKYPEIKGLPLTMVYLCSGLPGTYVFSSIQDEGFYLFEWREKKVKHIIIDSTNKIYMPANVNPLATDKAGNLWGITSEKKGIWKYNFYTGKIQCSWKGELLQFKDKRFKNVRSIFYSEKENALWFSYTDYMEKMYLQTGRSVFYSFFDDLRVQFDTSVRNRYNVSTVTSDRENNVWIEVGNKYLLKLDDENNQMEYLVKNDNMLPLGEWNWMVQITGNLEIADGDDILFWLAGRKEILMIRRSGNSVRYFPFETLAASGVRSEEYINTDTRQTIFLEKGRSGRYFLLQQNSGRPKLICFDRDFRIIKALFNNELKQYPAFFSADFNLDTFYIAFMRREIEPLNFRNVLKECKVDLRTFEVKEIKLDFKQRVWRYGSVDVDNVYWLFSNGTLYYYEPKMDILDSIFISKPEAKGAYSLELVKGFDYPTVLHKSSSTFWINFLPAKELYKVNMKTKKVEKVFKCCMDQRDCEIPGMIIDMYSFDSTRIYIQQGFSAMLLNVSNDSMTHFSDIFNNMLAIQSPNGSGLYKNWMYMVLPSQVHLLDIATGKHKALTLNRDFKWELSQLNSRPLVNDSGEMIVMSSTQKGFLVFNIDSIPDPAKPGIVQLSFVKLDNKDLPLDSLKRMRALVLKYNSYNSIQLGFSDYTLIDPEKVAYEYTLHKGGDTVWNKIEGKPELIFSELSSGKYQLLLRAGNGYSDYSNRITSFEIQIVPPFWQTMWFKVIIFVAVGIVFYGLYRYRMWQMRRVEIIRNNIASDLHDDIGSTLNSISIYSEVAKQQAGKEIPALDLIGVNSRKIIESMSDIVWTINPENDSFEKIIVRMRSFAYQLFKAKKVEYTFEVDEKLNSITLPMQVRKNFYLVFKEAITNLIKYSGANRVSILLKEEDKNIILNIRDNGIGIPVNAETQGNGLMNMKRRAEEIHAKLNIHSANGEGTGIELMLKT